MKIKTIVYIIISILIYNYTFSTDNINYIKNKEYLYNTIPNNKLEHSNNFKFYGIGNIKKSVITQDSLFMIIETEIGIYIFDLINNKVVNELYFNQFNIIWDLIDNSRIIVYIEVEKKLFYINFHNSKYETIKEFDQKIINIISIPEIQKSIIICSNQNIFLNSKSDNTLLKMDYQVMILF